MLISLTLAPLVKTQLKSELLPILLRVNAYQFCIPFCFSTEKNRTNRVDWVRLGSVIELNRTHKKVPVQLCSIDCFHDPIMQHVLGGSLHKNNISYLLLGLYHASVN